MARIIQDFNPRRGRPPEYPWEEWTDGRAWRITRGEDFGPLVTSMQKTLHSHAVRNGLDVATQLVPGVEAIDFQFSRPKRRPT